jgi:oligopeptide transport system substrate-binding protein
MLEIRQTAQRVFLVQISIILVTLACTVTLPLPDIFLNSGTEIPALEPPPTPPGRGLPPESFPVRYYHKDESFSIEVPSGWMIEEGNSPDSLALAADPGSESVITLAISTTLGDSTAQEAGRSFLASWLQGLSIEVRVEEEFTTSDGVEGWMQSGTTAGTGNDDAIQRWDLVTVGEGERFYHISIREGEDEARQEQEAFEKIASSFRLEPATPLQIPRSSALFLSSGEPLTLDPAKTHFGSGGMIGDIFSGLVILDPTMQIRPALAENWEVGDDGTTYTFHLNPSARFHNGRPVTVDDVLFSWERAAHPDTRSDTVLLYMGDIIGLKEYHAGSASSIEGIRAIDAYTLQVQIDAPKPYFLAKLSYPVAWVVDRYSVSLPNWEAHPNGTGPFRHVQHLDDEIFILERHPWYYNEAPHLEYIVYLIYAGYSQRLYQLDEIDYTGLTRDQLERATDPSDGLYGNTIVETGLCTTYVTFNTSQAPFDDELVRRAFVHAVDRERYVEAVTNSEAVVGRGVLPPGMPGYSDEVIPPRYDPDLARTLLEQSRYYADAGDPPEIIWTLGSSSGLYSGAAALLVDMWEENLGLQVQVEGIDWESYFDRIDRGDYGHLLFEGWCADYPDPENFLDLLFRSDSAQNHAYFSDTHFDSLIERARTDPDVESRLALYRQAEQYLLDQAPALFLSHSAANYGVWKPYVHGFIPSPIGVPQHEFLWIER